MSLRPKLSLIHGMETPSQGSMESRKKERSYMKRWRNENREEYNAYHREWRKENRERLNAMFVKRRKDGIAAMTQDQLRAFRQAESAKTKRLMQAVKDEVFMAYGGYVCACCGEREKAFLSIDHVHNDGNKMRQIHGESQKMYRWLRRNKFPEGFQVLCMNCNFGKRMNNGTCPHQARCNDHPLVGVGSSDPKLVGSE